MRFGSRSSEYSHLPSEIVYLILKSSPVKKLLQYRSVCKAWKEVIDSPWFVLEHLSHQTTPRVLVQRQRIYYLRTSGEGDEFEYFLPDADNGGFYDIITDPDGGEYMLYSHAGCSVHGALCFFYGDFQEIVLYNPSIRRQLRVQVPESCLPGGSRETNSCGFWMDPSAKEFKVVLLSALRRRIAVYSSRKKEWSETDAAGLLAEAEFYPCSQVLVGTVAYWAAATRSSGNFMLCYDFADDRLGSINFPVGCRKKAWALGPRKSCVTISKCGGLLEMIYLASCHPDEEYRVYVMVDGCWSARPSIRNSDCISQLIHVPLLSDADDQSCGPVLAASKSSGGELVLYHAQHKRVSPFCTPLLPRNHGYSYDEPEGFDPDYISCYLITTASSEFVQTLVSPCLIGHCILS